MRAQFGRGPTAVSKKVPFNFISRYNGHQCYPVSEECVMQILWLFWSGEILFVEVCVG